VETPLVHVTPHDRQSEWKDQHQRLADTVHHKHSTEAKIILQRCGSYEQLAKNTLPNSLEGE